MLAAAAALASVLLIGAAAAEVDLPQDAAGPTMVDHALAADRTPGAQPTARVNGNADHGLAQIQPQTADQQGRGLAVAALDDEPFDIDEPISVLSEEDALLALEREVSLKVGKQMRDEDYPQEAQRWRWAGTALIEVLVGANGAVKDVWLGRTSGFRVLDQQALAVVRRVSKLFVPTQLRGREVAVTIPIGFYLQGL